jgi:hypothetical protein
MALTTMPCVTALACDQDLLEIGVINTHLALKCIYNLTESYCPYAVFAWIFFLQISACHPSVTLTDCYQAFR